MQTSTNFQPTPSFWPRQGSGDAMAGLVEAGELLDVQVDQVTRSSPLVAAHRLLGRERGQAVQAEAHELGGDRRAGKVEAAGDLLAGHPALAQAHDQGLPTRGRSAAAGCAVATSDRAARAAPSAR